VTSGSTLSCTVGTLQGQLVKPYLQLDVGAADVATYAAVADGACTAGSHTFSGTFDAEGVSMDATGGTVTIESHVGTHLRGTLSIDFGADPIDGTFDLDGCA
jgi:hypothetical protein